MLERCPRTALGVVCGTLYRNGGGGTLESLGETQD